MCDQNTPISGITARADMCLLCSESLSVCRRCRGEIPCCQIRPDREAEAALVMLLQSILN